MILAIPDEKFRHFALLWPGLFLFLWAIGVPQLFGGEARPLGCSIHETAHESG